MVDVLALAVVVTMSVAHPYSVGTLSVMFSNINLVKDCNFSNSDVILYV